jgi:hypothetical protein
MLPRIITKPQAKQQQNGAAIDHKLPTANFDKFGLSHRAHAYKLMETKMSAGVQDICLGIQSE